MKYPEIYGFKMSQKTHETMNENPFVERYEKGVITKYELFSRARKYNVILPDQYLVEYEKWCEEHPEGPNMRTFSIWA